MLVACLSMFVGKSFGQSGVPANRQAKNIAVISIKGTLDAKGVMTSSVKRRMNEAIQAGADAIVFDIDTPGGSVGTVLSICNEIKSSSMKNTVAWINPDAFSGGAIIALACKEIVVNDPSNFGDAMPIVSNPFAFATGGATAPDRELLRKVLPPLISEVVDSTRRYNSTFGAYLRDEYLIQSIVANDVELWYVRNITTGVRMCIDRREFEMLFPGVDAGGPTRLASGGKPNNPPPSPIAQGAPPTSTPVPAGSAKLTLAAPDVSVSGASLRPVLTMADVGQWEVIDKVKDDSLPAVFKASDMLHYGLCANATEVVNGRTVLKPIRNENDLKEFFGASFIIRYDSNWSESLVDFLTNIIVRGVLIVIFLIAVFVEMSHPGTIVSAVVALAALLLLIVPTMLIGMATWWELVAIVLGIALLLIEAFVIPGFGIPGVLGLILLFTGLVFTFVPNSGAVFPTGNGQRDELLRGAVTMLLAFGTAGFGMYFIAKHFGSIPILGKLVLKTSHGDEESPEMFSAMDDQPLGSLVKVGEVGIAITPLRPSGRIQVGDHVVDAAAEFGFIDSGTKVRIVSVSAMKIGVEEARS